MRSRYDDAEPLTEGFAEFCNDCDLMPIFNLIQNCAALWSVNMRRKNADTVFFDSWYGGTEMRDVEIFYNSEWSPNPKKYYDSDREYWFDFAVAFAKACEGPKFTPTCPVCHGHDKYCVMCNGESAPTA